MRHLILFCLVLFFGSVISSGQAEECSITSYYLDKVAKFSSSSTLVTKFGWDREEKEITRHFVDKNSGVQLLVGAERISGLGRNAPKRIRVAIAFSESSEDVFFNEERAEAETVLDDRWKWLSVSKAIQSKNRIFTFTFGCERKGSKR